MKGKEVNMMRALRLRIKTGWLKEPPPDYVFLKRYPPATPARPGLYKNIQIENLPYIKLYDKVIERNPLFVDERVYPAYWEHQITPMAIAKRQYDLMKAGVPEEEAYHKAMDYVQEIENIAYEEMLKILETVVKMGATPLITDTRVSAELEQWRERLTTIPYDKLKPGDQGEIDYLIQAKILKWNPVQREIRMKDPPFVEVFNDLRDAILGIDSSYYDEEVEYEELAEVDDQQIIKGESVKDKEKRESETERKKIFPKGTLIGTNPFYYEDYMFFFRKAMQEPVVFRWSHDDAETLYGWIRGTLATPEDQFAGKTPSAYQRYIDELLYTYFPMVKFPKLRNSFQLPTSNELRKILFANQVGYQTVEPEPVAQPEIAEGQSATHTIEHKPPRPGVRKLSVHRYYKLPKLLFPIETFVTSCSESLELLRFNIMNVTFCYRYVRIFS